MLVALAVFSTVMAGISVVFISSLRAWRTGQENRSIFEMARASLRFMERDISSAFGSVDRDEIQTLVGDREWLTFVGITENPETGPYDPPKAHSDISRISYYLMPDELTGREDWLLIRLVSIDKDGLVDLVPDPRNAMGRDRLYFGVLEEEFSELAAGGSVSETDFELASNIQDLEFRYGIINPNADWDTIFKEEDPQVRGELWEGTVLWSPSWDSRNRPDRKLPDVIEVRIAVRAAAKMPTPETMVRVFRSTIFLPLGHRRPLPAVLQ